MKRLTVIAALTALALSAGPALGQVPDIGALVGVTFATLGGDSVSDAEYKTGLAAGVNISFDVAPGFAIRPELNYLQMGAEVSDPDFTGSLGLDYIQIPLLAVLSIPNPVGPRPYFFAGPAVAFEAGCTLEASGGGVTVSVDCDDPAADVLERKTVLWGLQGGAGLGFALGLGEATVDVRYHLGLTSIDDSGADADVKNRAFAVMLGYSIGLGM